MVILQTANLRADRARLAALGVRIVWQVELDDIATAHLHPRDLGGAIVSLDQPVPPESWRWGGPEWRGEDTPEGGRGGSSGTLHAGETTPPVSPGARGGWLGAAPRAGGAGHLPPLAAGLRILLRAVVRAAR